MSQPLEIWGGIECSYNRSGDRWNDQLCFTGHYDRKDDIKAFSKIGFVRFRYPVLWEKHQPVKNQEIDWSFAEKQLNELRACGITPIVGLVHNGCGPDWVNILEDSFSEGLAAFAKAFALRFPWVEYYTPVNEPLTNARFAGLYGHWFPNLQSDKAFVRILYQQCKGITLAMEEIQKVNTNAQLIQTEDLCKVYATSLLQYQADFENERRWLTFDLLLGKINETHPLYQYLLHSGLSKLELQFFKENSQSDFILGLNHYITSERFLDEYLEEYPIEVHGGNIFHQYADIEAIRVAHSFPSGLEVLIKEVWVHYKLPIVLTEVHMSNINEEERISWVLYVWNICSKLKSEGVEVSAITIWALLGSYGWDNLLTAGKGTYEEGIFKIEDNLLIPKELAFVINDLIQQPETLPDNLQNGWWTQDSRILYYANKPLPIPIL